MAKKSNMSSTMNVASCADCKVCWTCTWLLPIIILVVALVPDWYNTTLAKWVIVVAAVLLLLKKWCPCQKR
ncbi:MAG: hypothetical protein AABX16_00520 [Nanoarchaeota archaeon]